MVDEFDLVLVLVFIGVGFRHFEEDADVCVFGDAVAARVDFEAPLDAVDDVGVGVGDSLVR